MTERSPVTAETPAEIRRGGATLSATPRGMGHKTIHEIVVPGQTDNRHIGNSSLRAYKGAELRMAGADWFTIAETLGYKTTKAAMKDVTTFTKKYVTRDKREMAVVVDIELARLDALQKAHWQAAMAGDIPSGRFVLDIMRHRAHLVGATQTIHAPVQNNSTIIVGGGEADYVTALTRLRDAENVVDGEIVG